MSKNKPAPFNTRDVIIRAQTEILCAMLRLFERNNIRMVLVHKMYRFLNRDSLLLDGYLVEEVSVGEDFHNISVSVRGVDYEELDQTIHDVSEVDEDSTPEFFKKETSRFTVRTNEPDIDNLALLAFVYNEVEDIIEND